MSKDFLPKSVDLYGKVKGFWPTSIDLYTVGKSKDFCQLESIYNYTGLVKTFRRTSPF